MRRQLIHELEPPKSFDFTLEEAFFAGMPRYCIGCGIVAHFVHAHRTANNILPKSFAIGLGKEARFALDAETGMNPGTNHISAGLVDKGHFQKQRKAIEMKKDIITIFRIRLPSYTYLCKTLLQSDNATTTGNI